MHRLRIAWHQYRDHEISREQFRHEVFAFEKRHWAAIALSLLAIVIASYAAVSAFNTSHRNVTPQQIYGHNPSQLYNPNSALEGGEFSPTPGDIFAPPNNNAETYPGFPPGTRFLPGVVRDSLTLVSLRLALRFWNGYGLRPGCEGGTVKMHRYVDPEGQVLARSTVGGCDIFLDIHTKIPAFKKTWGAMGYCNLIVHEYGHSVGLLHSPNPQDIMYFTGNSRARTGCEQFAPQSFGTVAVTPLPTTVRCAGDKAVRAWLSGNYAQATQLATAAGRTCGTTAAEPLPTPKKSTILAALAQEKVCSDTNRGAACRSLFDRLAQSLSKAQRKRLACDVLAALGSDPIVLSIRRHARCPQPIRPG